MSRPTQNTSPSRRAGIGQRDARELERRLARSIAGEVRFDAGSRALHSRDGSNYRQIPIGVVAPPTPMMSSRQSTSAASSMCRLLLAALPLIAPDPNASPPQRGTPIV